MACNPDNVQFDTSMGTLIGKATVSANSMKEFVFPGVCSAAAAAVGSSVAALPTSWSITNQAR